MSDPLGHAAVFTDLPPDIRLLNRIVQGVLIHAEWLAAYGLDVGHVSSASRRTLPVSDRLSHILDQDPRSLSIARRPESRAIGTCRDFALMLCSILRTKGIPSRLRCGFASYLGGGWEDHWVCEYFDEDTQAWRLSDPQMDSLLGQGIDFDPADVPGRAFMTAGQAWLHCRDGRADPKCFGHGDTTGPWFLKVNVLRDHHALNGRETSAWDAWRTAPSAWRQVADDEGAWLDSIALSPQHCHVVADPDWPAS